MDHEPQTSAQGMTTTRRRRYRELLGLVADVVGLDAVALIVDSGEVVEIRSAWPRDAAGIEPGPATPDERGRLMEAFGGAGAVVESSAPIDDDGTAILVGSVTEEQDPEAARPRLDRLAELVASHLGVEDARRAAEDAGIRMASLVEAGMALGRELALDDLLTRIVQSAREVLGARYAALGVLDDTATELAQFVTAGVTEAQRAVIGDLPRGRGLLGALIRDARPLRLEDMADDPRRAGFPPNHPPMTSFLGVPVALRGEVFGNLYLTDKAGGPFTAEDEQIALTFASQAALAVDNVRRLERERRRVDELESVLEVARAALGVLDLDALLPLVARRARRLTGADTVGVAVIEEGDLVFRYAHGVDALGLEGSRCPAEMPALEGRLRGTLGAPAVEACPLEVAGELSGALVAVGWRPFDEGARRVLATFSSQVAIALANARAVAAERDLMREAGRREAAIAAERAEAEGLRRAVEAQEAERARVARELHDEAGQVMTALSVHLRALEDEVGPGPARERVAELRRQVGVASASVRELATRLRPSSLREHGLADAIEQEATRVRGGGVEVDVDLRGIGDGLPEDVETVLFRVVQEALTNTARHSEARNVSVVASAHGGRLRLVIEDDGRGFDPTAPTSRLGLSGIRERVSLIGGRLRIESSPGAGTAVMVDVDLPR